MGFFLLKAGSHAGGTIGDKDNPPRFYSAKDPLNNVVESDQDLAALYPEKFTYHEGAAPERGATANPLSAYAVRGQEGDPPPGPPTDQDRAAAAMAKPLTVADARKQAEWHRQQADNLDQSALESERLHAQSKESQQQKAPPAAKEEKSDTTKSDTVKSDTPKSPAAKKSIPSDHELNQMSKDDLFDLADEHKLDVKSSATKPEIIHALKQGRGK